MGERRIKRENISTGASPDEIRRDAARIAALRRQGLSVGQISKQTGLDRVLVNRHVRGMAKTGGNNNG